MAIVISVPTGEIQEAVRACNERIGPGQGGLPWESSTGPEH